MPVSELSSVDRLRSIFEQLYIVIKHYFSAMLNADHFFRANQWLEALWGKKRRFRVMSVKVIWIICIFGGTFASNIFAQQNIVPNPGFEKYAGPPVGWAYRGAYFGQVMKYWFSATTSSPDIYGPSVKVPKDWAEKGFGDQKAHGGKSMAGLTLWGCINGKPHCREYIEIQLSEPLVPGQSYYAEFWTTHLLKSLQINNLAIALSTTKVERKTDELIQMAPVVVSKSLVAAPAGRWVKVSGQFVATEESEFLLIGNFQDDNNTLSKAWSPDCFNYAYYYIDDVLLKKIPPFRPVPVKSDDLTLQKLEPGKTIRLKNIYFEFDRDELMPRSFVELNKLLKIMRDNPGMVIEILGHTDNVGDDTYNLDLSRRRAASVMSFLLENKIAAKRLRSKGWGESKPIATNETDEGRQFNRRVEFQIISLK
jgi:OmpA-OmpF porin, OOP family